MKETILEDDFGRRTTFVGEQLIEETTDNELSVKPQWLEVDVWRTEGGNYVVRRTTCYRVRHRSDECPRAEGYDLVLATETDTYNCPTCLDWVAAGPGYAQVPRTTVDAYRTPQDLIEGFKNDGKFSNLARAILADISEQDPRVDAAWNTVRVP